MRVIPVDATPESLGLEFGVFKKKVTTKAAKVEGPFQVMTSEGPLTCADGWVAFDQRGYPYPIADNEFVMIYEPVKENDNA